MRQCLKILFKIKRRNPPFMLLINHCSRNNWKMVLNTLSYREREILKLRFGIGDGYTHTLEEIGIGLT